MEGRCGNGGGRVEGGGGVRGGRKMGDVHDEGLDDAIDLEIEKVRRTPLAARITAGPD